MRFRDRRDAGRQLAVALAHHRNAKPFIFALPRGGVVVAAEIAAALSAPLDLLVVRKISLPQHPELAMGAVVDSDPTLTVRNEEVISIGGVDEAKFSAVRDREVAEMRRRRELYIAGRPRLVPSGRTAIVVDDGIATGATVRAALQALRRQQPRRLVLAVPLGAPAVLAHLQQEADEIVCLETPARLEAVGYFYDDFTQVSDDQVIAALAAAPASGHHG